MEAGMGMGDLPAIKCSSCGINVDISAMGDHVCGAKPAIETSQTSSSPPPPPPKLGFRAQSKRSEELWSSKFAKAELPARIDPLRANRPFLHPNSGLGSIDALVPFPLSTSSGSRSPHRALQRSQTSPLPVEPQSPDTESSGDGIPNFPLPRSMSERRVGGMTLKEAISAPPVPSPEFTEAMRTDIDPLPRSAHLPLDSRDQHPPPPPIPTNDSSAYGSKTHKHTVSIESKSSYRTSLASTRYGDRNSKRSTAMSSRRPSFGSMTRAGYKYEEEIPPMPPSPRNFLHHSVLSDSSMSDIPVKRNGKGEVVHGGFDFEASRASLKAEIEKPAASPLRVSSNANSDRFSGSRASTELFFSSPAQSTYGPPIDLPDPIDVRSVSPAGSAKIEYKAFKPSGSDFLQPNPPDHHDRRDEMCRKNSDATSESALSVSNFARALGLDISDEAVEASTNSSEYSPSETRSGTSLSSIQSDASMSRPKPSDQGRLRPVLEGLKTGIQSTSVLDEPIHTESPTSLEPPRIPDPLFSPDSPTDPALMKGSLCLIPDKKLPSAGDLPKKPPMTRSATEPATHPKTPRPRGPCRGCGEMIVGKSMSSADGRLTGRYHRACFVCFQCRGPFETADFYVLNDRPYCAQHYHERNGSLCATCHTGIEGQYLETNERTGRGPNDRQKFHPECLRCRTCHIDLKGEYFEWNGLVYCERDARRAAAAMSPHRFGRPALPSSPLAPPSRGHHPPPGYPGRGRGLRPPPGARDGPYPHLPPGGPHGPPSARRFPERRTTKLMMT
ncbi:hypothetical protein P175DRAFT_0516957 [Aspergillus ochraceoroseus IBT 24754]|uniref:LIM zinc-binding domain-containing protein n=2 Tax=Aspergillus subgen. Nidulantes TaxID=2720870 RepID=A0A0F8X939_9EURO|nr:uncharacterized protein P175DRAFT_0516957 [Aspergillus ochraceoroseus IBT 24754]KKK20127.1 hypothetical protein ARAM_004375 [Aspergillus rambellii]PTU19905.1 hypothetical protein P175DRAFT_0516957 [Aspergillus ochraceoroseus IBT 24754]